MSLSKELHKYERILYNPNITEGQVEYVERKLNQIIEKQENYKTHILLGKLYLVKNNISLAKIHFFKAQRLNNQAQSAYYGLFKINVVENDYDKAKHNIEKFISLDMSGRLNIELYRLLLDKILGDESDYKIGDTYFYEKLSGQNLILYLTAVKHILENQYKEAIETLSKLDELAKMDKLPIDFQFAIKLINKLKLMELENANKLLFDDKIELLKDCIWNGDIDRIKEIFDEIFKMKLSDKQIKYILHMIPRLINIDQYEIANSINEYVIKKDLNNIYTRKTAFYKKLIDELYEIYMLTGDKKSDFQESLRNGLDYMHEGNFEQALHYFTIGSYQTNIRIFDYYMGKTLFMLNRYKAAKRSLDIYNEKGAYKIYNCKHYLSIISLKFGKKGKSIKLVEDAEYYASLLNKTYKSNLDPFNTNDEKKLGKLFELIDMKEEDFTTGRSLIKE